MVHNFELLLFQSQLLYFSTEKSNDHKQFVIVIRRCVCCRLSAEGGARSFFLKTEFVCVRLMLELMDGVLLALELVGKGNVGRPQRNNV